MNETLKFQAKFEDIKPFNSEFSFCKIYTLYTGINRNNSYLTKETVNSSLEGLFNVPIIGEYLEDAENFGGHGGKWEITEQGINYIQTTKALGLVPESAEVYWENVTEPDGTINEYLVIDKAILWTGRFKELSDILNHPYGQSMEINIDSGDYIEKDGVKTYEIKKFTWSALCILGIDKDGEGKIEPCFESASIIGYSLDKDVFKMEFAMMLKELKSSLQPTVSEVAEELKEGGNKIVPENILVLLKKYDLTENDLTEKGITYSEFSFEDLEAKINEAFQVNVEVEAEAPATFSLTSEQMECELRRELAEIETLTEVWYDEVYTSPRYYYRDHKPDQNIVIAMDEKNWYLVGATYTVVGDAVEVDESTIVRYKLDYNPMDLSGDTDEDDSVVDPEELIDDDDMFSAFTSKAKAEFMIQAKEKSMMKQFEIDKVSAVSEVTSKLTELQEKYSVLEARANALDAELIQKVEAERKQAEDAVFESFSTALTEDEMALVKSKKNEMSIQDIEEKLFALVGKKTKVVVNFSKSTEEVKPLRYSIVNETSKPVSDKSYADLIKMKE